MCNLSNIIGISRWKKWLKWLGIGACHIYLHQQFAEVPLPKAKCIAPASRSNKDTYASLLDWRSKEGWHTFKNSWDTPLVFPYVTPPYLKGSVTLEMTLFQQGGWTRRPTEVPSNPKHSVILPCEETPSSALPPRLILEERENKSAESPLENRHGWIMSNPSTHQTQETILLPASRPRLLRYWETLLKPYPLLPRPVDTVLSRDLPACKDQILLWKWAC